MATTELRDRLQPALLDRLTDHSPHQRVESEQDSVMTKAQLRQAVLRDLVWAPAQLTFANGAGTVCLLPVRYPGTAAQADGALQLARKTEWLELGDGQYRGLGQRVIATDAAEVGLLEVRSLTIHPAAAA